MQRANGERNTHGVRVCILHACILPPPPSVRAGRGGIGCPGVGARVRVFARAKERCARDVLARSARGHAWNPEQTIPSFVFPPIPSFPLSSSCLTACLPTYLPTYLPIHLPARPPRPFLRLLLLPPPPLFLLLLRFVFASRDLLFPPMPSKKPIYTVSCSCNPSPSLPLSCTSRSIEKDRAKRVSFSNSSTSSPAVSLRSSRKTRKIVSSDVNREEDDDRFTGK